MPALLLPEPVPEAPPEAGEAWRFAREALAAGDPQQALAFAERALRDEAPTPWGLALQSLALTRLGDDGAAREAARAAVRHGSNVQTLCRLARCEAALGDLTPALLRAREAVSAAPDRADGYLVRAEVAFLRGDGTEVLAALDHARRQGPLPPEGELLQGEVLLRQGDRTEALRTYLRVLEVPREDLRALAQVRVVTLVETGALSWSRGIRDMGFFVLFLAGLLGVRAAWEGQWLTALACPLGASLGLLAPAWILAHAARLRLDEQVPGAWQAYERARGGRASPR